ncbi:Fimh-like protein [hydrothermal vent metagenome]|uniref:Fimh-like protein n=1 Tax=hydrothermal vent metagenome TaxID=652676 RepID=A0A1W1BH75_9ZZZZ
MKKIIFIMISVSMLLYSTFNRDDTNGVVTDSKTGLIWQDDYSNDEDFSERPIWSHGVKSASWAEAIDYCEELTLGGNDDWRLPNRKELLSIVKYSAFEPSINSVFKSTPNPAYLIYWSSTTANNDTSDAHIVDFAYGSTNKYSKHVGLYVRCVRG